ncbi:hypothetical protein CEXT_591831 [Caerostris extrusa]|uniref:Uncharacterized protein n=1 Tax=Caerostris extrusa TaxID=172846 RepID=A0AAV4W7F4_CAEEX|nr:hypothetical protein CEXT_591831 [Caerostris extrusa]
MLKLLDCCEDSNFLESLTSILTVWVRDPEENLRQGGPGSSNPNMLHSASHTFYLASNMLSIMASDASKLTK